MCVTYKQSLKGLEPIIEGKEELSHPTENFTSGVKNKRSFKDFCGRILESRHCEGDAEIKVTLPRHCEDERSEDVTIRKHGVITNSKLLKQRCCLDCHSRANALLRNDVEIENYTPMSFRATERSVGIQRNGMLSNKVEHATNEQALPTGLPRKTFGFSRNDTCV